MKLSPPTKIVIMMVLIALTISISFQVMLIPADAFAWFVIPIITTIIGAGLGAAGASGGTCNIYSAPLGGTQETCGACQNNPFIGCTEYKCKALGQSCEFLKDERKCIAADEQDVAQPIITGCEARHAFTFARLNTQHTENGCELSSPIPEFESVVLKLTTDEVAQCRYSLAIDKSFNPADKETSWFTGEALFTKEHVHRIDIGNATEFIEALCRQKETCAFYIRCQDRRGNKMEKDYFLNFRIQEGPDLTPPIIMQTEVSSGVSIPSSRTEANFTMWVADRSGVQSCKYSKQDKAIEEMELNFTCSSLINLEEGGFECSTKFALDTTRDNKFYFRCQDKARNQNEASYPFLIKPSQPLQFTKLNLPTGLVVKPSALVEAATNNKALCYYSLDSNKEQIFNATDSLLHSTNIPTDNGNHELKIRCIDEAGNEKDDDSDFKTEFTLFPVIKRIYKSSGLIFIQVNQEAKCVYSTTQPELNFKDGTEMQKLQGFIHKVSQQDTNALVYHIICRNAATNTDSQVYTIYP